MVNKDFIALLLGFFGRFKKKPGGRHFGRRAGLWILDLGPLEISLRSFGSAYISVFAPPLVSTGRITRRLQRRHLISTPSGISRASKLPQQQRSGAAGVKPAPDSSWRGDRVSI
jgi:hypothetical protein